MKENQSNHEKLDSLLAANNVSNLEGEIDPDHEWLKMMQKIENKVDKELQDIELPESI